jgi:hypothetical protein
LGFFGLALLLLALLYQWLKQRSQAGRLRWLAVLIMALSLPAIVVPLFGFVYLNDAFSSNIDTPSRLLIADGTGMYGISNMVLVFNSEAPNQDTLTWGQGDTMTTVTEDKASREHVFMLRTLTPDEQYSYQVNDSPAIDFTTPPASQLLHFAVASDAHFGAGDARNDLTAQMLSEISNPANDFDAFFFLGDLVEYGFQKDHWQSAFDVLAPTVSVIPTRFAPVTTIRCFRDFTIMRTTFTQKKWNYRPARNYGTGLTQVKRISLSSIWNGAPKA